MFTVRETLDRTGMSEATLYRHVYQYKTVIPVKRGHWLFFTESDIETLKAAKRGPGNPHTKSE